MPIWSAEIKELEKLYESFKGQFPDLEKELERLIRADDENMILLYSRRCLEVIITDLCECELRRERGTEPLKGIIDKLRKERKVTSNIITSMDHLNSLSAYGAHPKDFDPEQVKPVLVNLDIIIKWYLKYKDSKINVTGKSEEIKDEGLVSDDTVKKIQKPKKRLILLLTGLALVVAIVVVALFVFNIIRSGRQIKYLEKSIAVLPFRNESSDQENSAFVNGLMEKILNNLQLIKDFRVISRTSVEQYRGQNKLITDIAKELGVNYIVEGSAQKYGNAFSLSVQLIKADKKEDHLWGRSFEQEIKEVDDILNIQSEIAEAIAQELEANITTEEKQLIEKISTRNLTALDFYQTGREEHWKYWTDPHNLTALNKAEGLYKKALQYDPTFAQAYIGLADVYWNKNISYGYLGGNRLDSALIFANSALSYNADLADAYVIRGNYFRQKGYNEQALKEYDKALDINPNIWQAYVGRAYIYGNDDLLGVIENLHKAISVNRGRELSFLLGNLAFQYSLAGIFEKAREYNEETFEIDKDSISYISRLAGIEYNAGNLEKSIELSTRIYQLDSTNINILYGLGSNYGYLGDDQESLIFLEKWITQMGEVLTVQHRYNGIHRLAYAYWKNNRQMEARQYFDLQMEYCNQSIVAEIPYAQTFLAYYDRACLYAFMGEKDKALEDLRIFNNKTKIPSWLNVQIKVDPLLDSLRDELEFQQVLNDVEAKYQAEHERVRKWLEEQGML